MPRKHELLMMLDEFVALGRLDFFETSLAFMAGYGIRVYLIAQSLNQVDKAYGELKVIQNFTASVSRGEKIALIGRNGAGKTTMLRSLLANAPGFVDNADREFVIDGGLVTWGHEVSVGYFAQDHEELPV